MYRYYTLVTVKDHPTLHEFYGKDQQYVVVNFKPIHEGERVYLIQPNGSTNKYKVVESNLELVNAE